MKKENEVTTWFTSDLHFGHRNIIEYCRRPFGSVHHMNEELIRRWNDRVADSDVVYVLGDVAMGKIAETLPLVGRLRGRKVLVPGNHDRCWSGHRKVRDKDIQMYWDVGLAVLNSQVRIEVNGVRVDLCHFPFEGDSHERDRYVEHRPSDVGQWLLHGHVHDSWKVKGRQVNVGVDVWDYTPVNEEDIIRLVAV
jgi:calcineurin-like phosphoesterase family protein